MQTIVFIHGMFQNDKSWAHWIDYFEQLGYTCLAPAWPMHEGEPKALRQSPPPGLGDLRLNQLIMKMEDVVNSTDEKPIVIGHGVGGLITQILAGRNAISLGVVIASVAPNSMLSLDWDFFKNAVTITNPLKGDEPIYMDLESFHKNFCNTLNADAAAKAYEDTVTYDSRNVLRDCMSEPGEIDVDLPHAPLLFISAEEDNMIPCKLVEKNAEAYTDQSGIADYKEFFNRSHFICGEPEWEQVAAYIAEWIGQQQPVTSAQLQQQLH